MADVPGEPIKGEPPQNAGQDGPDPDVPESRFGVGNEIKDKPDADDEEKRGRETHRDRLQPVQRLDARHENTEPRGLRHLHRADEQQCEDHHAAGGDQHQERDHAMLPEAALLLHAPCLVDGARDCPEHAERCPDEGEASRDANLDARLSERIELGGDELELRRKVAEDKREDGDAIRLVGCNRAEQRDAQQQEWEE